MTAWAEAHPTTIVDSLCAVAAWREKKFIEDCRDYFAEATKSRNDLSSSATTPWQA